MMTYGEAVKVAKAITAQTQLPFYVVWKGGAHYVIGPAGVQRWYGDRWSLEACWAILYSVGEPNPLDDQVF